THEVGHWLNLKHIWGDEPACNADDLVADTPQQKRENYFCPTFPVGPSAAGGSCSGISSMFMNYMDYVDDACMYMFTKGQRDRMIAVLNTTRASLALSVGCQNTLAANFTANTTTVAAGGSVNFTSTSTGGPTAYAWTFQGGTPGTSTAQNPTGIVYNTPGTYPVSLTITGPSGSHTRTVPGYITVTNPSSCADTLNLPFPGQPTLYTSSSGGVSNGYVSGNNGFGDKAKAEYFANAGSSNQVTGGIFSFGVAKAANASSAVTITVWDNSGTGGKPGTVLGSQTLPISTIAANIASNSLTTVNFTNPVIVSGPFYMGVQLSNAPGDTVALITNRHNDSPAGLGWEQDAGNTWESYSTNWNLNISNAIFPLVDATPPVVNFTSSATTTCTGTSVTFNAGTTGATAYSWSFPGGTPATSTAANPTVTYTTAGSYNVSLTASTTACNMITTVNRPNAITVIDAPTIIVNPAAPQFCTPTPVSLTASGATTYTWSPATGLSSTTGASVVANPTTSTVYTVTGTTAGCSSTAQVAITVSNINTSFTASPTIINLANMPGTVTFTNNTTNATFYNWNFGDPGGGAANTSSVRNPPAYTYTAPGTYTVTLTSSVSSGCNDVKTATITVVNAVGLEEAFASGSIKIYPNPAQNYLNVEVPQRENITEISLTNAIGQVMATQKPAAGQARLKVSSLPAGIYFVKISNAEGSITKKISVNP
ncbi:MAG TPA: PKD domain-containing protein, partial [Adhaeribacter sp.]|nr:PKD domain-containing protein [Adhaeribacter sp.]